MENMNSVPERQQFSPQYQQPQYQQPQYQQPQYQQPQYQQTQYGQPQYPQPQYRQAAAAPGLQTEYVRELSEEKKFEDAWTFYRQTQRWGWIILFVSGGLSLLTLILIAGGLI